MSKRIERKQSIIQAAIEVFGEKNFANSRISEIAEKANVAEGTIYQYFKNKEDLFFSIPLEKSMEFSRELELHLQGIRGASNKISKFIWYYLHFFTKNPGYGRTLMLDMRVSKNFVKTTAYESFRPVTDAILEIIKEGQQERVIRDDVSLYIIRQLILGVLEHMVTRWLLSEQRYDLLEHCDEVNKLIMGGMGMTHPVVPSTAQGQP